MSDHATHDYNDPAAPPRLCENCQTPLRGPYCSACGQHDFDVHRSFRHVFHEALESFFHFDGKFFSSIVDLLFHPGRLTVAFNAGKRVSQVPPLRFYVFVSLLFFVWLSFNRDASNAINIGSVDHAAASGLNLQRELQDDAEDKPASSAAAPQAEPAINSTTTGTATETPAATPAKKSTSDGLGYEDDHWVYRNKSGEDATWGRWLADKLNHRHEISETFLHFVPKMLLLCLPLFALYTRVLFRRSGLVYLQHLVLALHLHTFAYLYRMFVDGWERLAALISPGFGRVLLVISLLYAGVYFFLTLKRVFRESGLRTFVKSGLLFVCYWLTLSVAAIVTIGIAVLLT